MSTRPRRHSATVTKKKLIKQLGHPRRKQKVTKHRKKQTTALRMEQALYRPAQPRPCQPCSRRLNLRSNPICDECHGSYPVGATISMYAKEKDTWYRLCFDCRRVYAASEEDANKAPESGKVSKLKSFLKNTTRLVTSITGNFLSINR